MARKNSVWIVSVFSNSYLKFGVDAAIAHLPQIGIDFLEFPVRTAGQPTFFGDEPWLTNSSSREEIAAVRSKVSDAGLKVLSANITSGNPLKTSAFEITLDKLQVAHELGARYVVAGAGEANSREEHEQLVQRLQTIGDRAESLGITYCCETHPGACQSVPGMLQTMEDVDHPAVRLNFDTGNLSYYNEDADVLSGLQQVRDWVAHVHLKEHAGGYQEWNFPELGRAGRIDFTVVRELLDEVHFCGPYSLEIEGVDGESATLARCQQRIERSLAHLQDCGYFSINGLADEAERPAQ